MFALLLRYFTAGRRRAFASLFAGVRGRSPSPRCWPATCWRCCRTTSSGILAYSSIAHLGYLLVAFLAGRTRWRASAVDLLPGGLLRHHAGRVRRRDARCPGPSGTPSSLEDYRGLAWRRPWLAGAFTAMLLSLAGIPLTAGFVGKFYVVTAGVGSAQWLLVIALVIASAIGLFYYLRLVTAMYQRPEGRSYAALTAPSLTWATGLTLAALTLLLVWLGVNPSPLISVIQAMVGGAA